MIKLLRTILCSGVFSIGLLSTANANLEVRLGGRAVYDTDLNITWLADANYAQTSGYDADGKMNWFDANTWASSLNIGGVSGWRLPKADTNCLGGTTCTDSEMGHLYEIELGVHSPNPITESSDPDLALFTNIRLDYYWASEEYSDIPDTAWIFYFHSGHQIPLDKHNHKPAWAVHDGDVALLVPEPETYAMLMAGLGLLGFMSRRRKESIV